LRREGASTGGIGKLWVGAEQQKSNHKMKKEAKDVGK
jgi:hypothetical protein